MVTCLNYTVKYAFLLKKRKLATFKISVIHNHYFKKSTIWKKDDFIHSLKLTKEEIRNNSEEMTVANWTEVSTNIHLTFIIDLKFTSSLIKGSLNLKPWVLAVPPLEICNFCNVVDTEGFIIKHHEPQSVFPQARPPATDAIPVTPSGWKPRSWPKIYAFVSFSLSLILFPICFVITAKRWCSSPCPRVRRTNALARMIIQN